MSVAAVHTYYEVEFHDHIIIVLIFYPYERLDSSNKKFRGLNITRFSYERNAIRSC